MAYPGFYTGEDVTINGVPLNRVDASGCKWVLEDLDGWWGLPEPNVPDDTRAFSEDGSFYAPGRYEARQITMKGRIVPPGGLTGPRATAIARNTLNQALNLVRTTATLAVRDGSVLSRGAVDAENNPVIEDADLSQPGIQLAMTAVELTQIASVQLIGRPLTRFDALNNVLEFNFQLRAADPRKYSSVLGQGSTTLLADSSGRSYDRSYDYSYGEDSGSDGLMTVINSGSYNTFGVLRINGPVVNPSIEHIELAKTLSLDLRIGTDEFVDINLRDRTVYFNSTASRRGALKPASSWFWIQPGVNTLRYTGSQTIPARPEYLAATNLATNPSFETAFGTVLSLTNLVTTPRPSSATTNYTYSAAAGETGLTVAGGQDPSPAGILLRTNYARNPQSNTSTAMFGSYGAGTGETGASTIVQAATPDELFDGPLTEIRSYSRRSITLPKSSGSTGWQARTAALAAPVVGSIGDKYSASVYVRYTAPEGTVEGDPAFTTEAQLRMSYQAVAGTDTQSVDTSAQTLVSGMWTRVHVTGTATTNFVSIGWWLFQTTAQILPAGSTIDVSGVLIERNTTTDDTARTYFDGSIGDTTSFNDKKYLHAWTGTAHASTSTETQTVVENAVGFTGLPGFIRRIVNAPGTAGSRSMTYESPAGTIAGTTGNIRTISAYVRSGLPLDVQFVGSAVASGGSTVGSTTSAVVSLEPGVWTRLSATVTATGTYDRVRGAVTFSQPLALDQTLDITSTMVTSGADLYSYFDGSYAPDSLDGTVAWTGTPDASTSTLAVPGVKMMGPASASMTSAGGALSIRSTRWSVDGQYSLAIDTRSASSNGTLTYPAGSTASTALTRLNMVAGQTYTLSAYLYVPEIQQGALVSTARTMALDLTQPSGTTTNYAISNQTPNEPGVYRVNFTVTLPADTTGVVLKLINGSQQTTVFWDGLMIEPGNTVSTEYVDGNSPWASWSGLANDSTSSRPYVEGVLESMVQLSYRSAWIE